MKCTQCGDEKTLVKEIRDCPRCTQPNDGTAALVPTTIYDGQHIREAIAVAPGLANRFVGGDAPAEEGAAAADTTVASEDPVASEPNTVTLPKRTRAPSQTRKAPTRAAGTKKK